MSAVSSSQHLPFLTVENKKMVQGTRQVLWSVIAGNGTIILSHFLHLPHTTLSVLSESIPAVLLIRIRLRIPLNRIHLDSEESYLNEMRR